MSLSYRTIVTRTVIGLMLSLLALSCKQYEYASPLPGILEVRLRVVNSAPPTGHANQIPFSPFNFFQMRLKDLKVVKEGLVKQTLFADLNAINRIDGGDVFNTLDTLARDSMYILGQGYVPPETYSRLELGETTFDPLIVLFRGLFRDPYTGVFENIFQTVDVVQPQPPEPTTPTFFQVPPPNQPASITVNEGRLTRVTLSLNLDTVLVRRTEVFEIRPFFTISSIQNF